MYNSLIYIITFFKYSAEYRLKSRRYSDTWCDKTPNKDVVIIDSVYSSQSIFDMSLFSVLLGKQIFFLREINTSLQFLAAHSFPSLFWSLLIQFHWKWQEIKYYFKGVNMKSLFNALMSWLYRQETIFLTVNFVNIFFLAILYNSHYVSSGSNDCDD